MKKLTNLLLLIIAIFSLISCTKIKVPSSEIVKNDEMGMYPQTKVVDNDLINNLKKISEVNELGYIEYDQNEYLKYNNEYFLVEPIKWVKFTINNENYYVTEKIIDRQVFMSDEYFSPNIYSYINKPGTPEGTHANNYYYSDLREWLNSYFISTAFTSSQVKNIKKATVSNNLASTMRDENKYICDDTNDYIFALSAYEASFVNNNASKPTDYAIARGVVIHNDNKIDPQYNGYACSWLRSPNNFYSYCVMATNYDGLTYEYVDCYYLGIGVRPAFILK